jgi:parallel beta-helix repeat protein
LGYLEIVLTTLMIGCNHRAGRGTGIMRSARILALLILGAFLVPNARACEPNASHRAVAQFDLSGLNESMPIDIRTNADFESKYSFEGNGTPENPYLIENLYINLNSSAIPDDFWLDKHSAITVYCTSAHFVIRNCLFAGEARWDNETYVEPFLDLRGYGIHLQALSNATVYNNTFAFTTVGVYGYYIHDCNLTGNSFLGNPLAPHPMEYSVGGIEIEENSAHNIISFNTMQYCWSGVLLEDTHDNSVLNNTMTQSDCGIHLWRGAFDNLVAFNNCSHDYFYGICVGAAWNNMISNNTVCWNVRAGILVQEQASGNIIAFNLVAGNGVLEDAWLPSDDGIDYLGHGIYLEEGSDNTLIQNDVIGNRINAQNDVSENLYDSNYWSDYEGVDSDGNEFGDTPYEIRGVSTAFDDNPRMESVYGLDHLFVEPKGVSPLQPEIVVASIAVVSCVSLAFIFLKRKLS